MGNGVWDSPRRSMQEPPLRLRGSLADGARQCTVRVLVQRSPDPPCLLGLLRLDGKRRGEENHTSASKECAAVYHCVLLLS